MKIKDKILKSRSLAWTYAQYQDFEHGRGIFGKVTSMSQEFNFAMLVATFFFGVNLKDHILEAIMYTAGVLFIVYLLGKYYRRMNLLEVDQRAAMNRSPIGKIQLEAAELIIKEYGEKKNGQRDRR